MTDFSDIKVGAKIYGYCAGYFGRETDHVKKIEALGPDWVVARNSKGVPEFAEGGRLFEVLKAALTDTP